MKPNTIAVITLVSIISVLAIFGFQCVDAEDSGSCGTNLTWSYSEGTLNIQGEGTMNVYNNGSAPWAGLSNTVKKVVIGSDCLSISQHSFRNFQGLSEVVFDNGFVGDIGSYAFYGCTGLESIRIPVGAASIGDYSFYGCTGLKTLSMAGGSASIGSYAFYGCNNLEHIIIPAGVTSVGAYAFYDCTSAKSIKIGSGLSQLNERTFGNCYSVTVIEYGATSATKNFRDSSSYCPFVDVGRDISKYVILKISDGCQSIPEYAFNGCSRIGSVTFPQSLKTIGSSAFTGTSITKLEFNDGLTSIGSSTFSGLKIKSIEIPDSVTSIGSNAFYNCTSVKSIKIGSGLSQLNGCSFGNCYSVEEIVYGATSATNTNTYDYYNPFVDVGRDVSTFVNLTISDGVKSLPGYAFNGCSRIGSVTFPQSLQTIGDYAFASTRISSLEFNKGLQSVGSHAFSGSGVKSIEYPVGFKASIGSYAFSNCTGLESVVVPDDVTSVGSYAFYGCTSAKSISIGSGLSQLNECSFGNCHSVTEIEYSATSATKNFRDSSSYCPFVNIGTEADEPASLVISYGVKSLPGYAFNGCSRIGSVTFPQSLQTIGDYAFASTGISSLEFNKGLQSVGSHAFSGSGVKSIEYPVGFKASIGSYAFSNCTGLESVVVPDDVTSVGSYAFYGCTSAKSIKIGSGLSQLNECSFGNCHSVTEIEYGATSATKNFGYYSSSCPFVDVGADTDSPVSLKILYGVKSVPSYSFYNCSHIKSISFPRTLQEIEDYAFASTGISSLEFNKGLQSVGSYAFSGSGVKSIEYPVGFKASIGSYAFSNCTGLESVVVPDDVTSVGSYAFYGCTSAKSIKIGSGLSQLNGCSFGNCHSVTEIEYGATSASGNFGNSYPFINVGADADNPVSLKILYGVKSVPSYAFCNCSHLGSVEFNKTMEFISSNSFQSTGIQSLLIPSNITTIQNSAFYNCSNLESIVIPDTVTTIGSYAFYGCTSAKSIKIGSGLSQLNECSFGNCYSVAEIKYGATSATKNFGYYSSSCPFVNVGNDTDGYVELTIQKGVNSVPQYLFNGCSNIRSVTIETSVQSIDAYAFSGCSGIKIVSIASDVTSIDPTSFGNLTFSDAEGNVLDVSAYALAGRLYVKKGGNLMQMEQLPIGTEFVSGFVRYEIISIAPAEVSVVGRTDKSPDVVIPTTVSSYGFTFKVYSIGADAFNRDRFLETIELGDISYIDADAFSDCQKIKYINIPSSVFYIDPDAFVNTDFFMGDDQIDATADSLSGREYVGYGGKLYVANRINVGFVFSNGGVTYKVTSVDIPQVSVIGQPSPSAELIIPFSVEFEGSTFSVTGISSKAFYRNAGLTSVSMEGVQKIDTSAFARCINLKNVEIGEGAKILSSGAFNGCPSLSHIKFPSTLEYVSKTAFDVSFYNKNEKLDANAESLEYRLFEGKDGSLFLVSLAPDLGEVFIDGSLKYKVTSTDPFYASVIGFDGEITQLAVPKTVDYKNQALSVTAIDKNAFKECATLTTADLGYVTTVGSLAFYGCSKLSIVDLGEAHDIGQKAFAKCKSLKYLTIPETVKHFSKYSFFGCDSLRTLVIPGDDVMIDDSAFSACKKMETISFLGTGAVIGTNSFYMNNSVKTIDLSRVASIGTKAFPYCNGLETIVIPGNVGKISPYAFCSCNSLKSLVIEDGIVSVGASAFSGCRALESVSFPNTLKSIGKNAFYGIKFVDESGSEIANAADMAGKSFYGQNGKLIAGNNKPMAGDIFISDGLKYSVVSVTPYEASLIGYESSVFNLSIPQTVNYKGVDIPVVSVGNNAFKECTTLQSVDLGSITTVGTKAFAKCYGITSLSISANVSSYSFFQCTGLKSLTIASADVGAYAFSGCKSLETVEFNDIGSIESNAFNGLTFVGSDGIALSITAKNLSEKTFAGTGARLIAAQ